MKRPLNEIETFRAQELLLQRATEGLDDRETAELVALGAEDDLSFELAASAVDLATIRVDELPIDVADKILIAAGVDAARTTVMPAMVPMTLAGVVMPRPISTTTPPVAHVEPAPLPAVPTASAARATPASASTPTPVISAAPAPVIAPTPPVVAAAPTPVIAPTPPVVRAEPAPAIEPHAAASSHLPVVTFTPPHGIPRVIPIEAKRKSRAVTYAVIAAAASIALAAGAVVWATQRPPTEKIVEVAPPPPKTPTMAEARAELLATAKDVTTLPWTATQDPNAAGASGEVVWSASAQRGYMRFKGLAPNDSKAIQYQLWIFDKDRDQAFPVDGGVFDVSSTGEVIIPITAKLRVDQPVLFAVTVEKPGGVVVSKRERIVVTAAPKTG